MADGVPPFESRLHDAQRRVREFGPTIRALRRKRATAAVARLLGMSAQTLYRIETGAQEPSYEQALLIAEAIGRPLEDISGPLRPKMWTRKLSSIPAEYGEWSLIDKDALVPGPIQLRLHAGATDAMHRHDGFEWLYIAQGSVRVEFAFRRDDVALDQFGYYIFDASNPHSVINTGPSEAVLLRGMSALGILLHTGEWQ